MNYKDYLAEVPFLDEFPRQIVVMQNSDGSGKILHVNNQLISAPYFNGEKGQLYQAIMHYFENNDHVIEATIFNLENEHKKEVIGTIKNS